MRRILAAAFIAGIASAAAWFEASPQGAPIRQIAAEWLAANALSGHPEKIAAIELPSGPGGMSALDAALVLRAILRFEPKAVGFLVPIEPGGDESLLVSKLQDAKIPLVFTANESLEPLPKITAGNSLPQLPAWSAFAPQEYPRGGLAPMPSGRVSVVARQGKGVVASNVWRLCLAAENSSPAEVTGTVPGSIHAGSSLVPVDAIGAANLNPLAKNYVEHIAFPQLVLQTERSEQGSISAVLDGEFRGRIVTVQKAGKDQAAGVAALRNRLADFPAPMAVTIAGVLLAMTLPWWCAARGTRVLLAFMASGAWMLMALAIYAEFRMTAPLLIVALLPVLALISPAVKRPSDKIQQRELPA